MTAKQLEDIHNFKKEGDESLYLAWERYNDLLYKCPTHDINSHQKVNNFYKGLSTMNRQLLDSQGPIPGMRPTEALIAIHTMADHSQKCHDGTTSRNIGSNSSKDRLAALVNKLDNLGRDMKKLKESVHAIRVGCQNCEGPHLDKDCPLNEEVKQVKEVRYGEFRWTTPFDGNNGGRQTLAETVKKYIEAASIRQTNNNEDCKAIFTNDGALLYTPFYYSLEEIEYFSANSGFSDDDELKNVTSIPNEDLKQTSPKQTTTHYIEPYVPPIPFPSRLEQHAEEALIHKTIESLKKIKSNRPFLKEIWQSNEYPKFMKDLLANKPLTMENEDIRINHRCSALLLNQLEGIGKLETIKMNIELTDNSKCIPKGIVRNLLIKINKFILPVDFIILDVLEDYRMPVILGRPLLTTAHVKIDVFKRSISLEAGNKKVIFKLKSDLPDMKNESVLMIQSNIITEKNELLNIESYLLTYNTNTCESCHILAIDTDLFTYEVVTHETYKEIAHKCCLTTQDVIGEKTNPILGKRKSHWEVDETMKKKILTEHWRKRFGIDYDDNDDFYDPNQCGESKNNEIRERIIRNLHEEWFNGTSEDEEDIEGIIDYLEPTSYDGFVDFDEAEYKKRRCRLLGMSYIEPLPIIIEQVKITRYSLGPGEVYTKLEVLNTEELPRTRHNVATIRSNIMEEVLYEDEVTIQKLRGNYRDRLDSYSFGILAEFAAVTELSVAYAKCNRDSYESELGDKELAGKRNVSWLQRNTFIGYAVTGSISINRGLIQAIPTSLPSQPIREATKASNLQRIPPGVQGRSHFTYFLYLIIFLDYRVTLGFGSTGGLDLACPINRLSCHDGIQWVLGRITNSLPGVGTDRSPHLSLNT
ncbi:hypothetical protein Tco_0340535 [Tanacetum coccineum]